MIDPKRHQPRNDWISSPANQTIYTVYNFRIFFLNQKEAAFSFDFLHSVVAVVVVFCKGKR